MDRIKDTKVNVLHIVPDGGRPNADLATEGMRCDSVIPSFLSAFTAMKIAAAVDRHSSSVVLSTRLDDAMAAISARKIAKSKFKIVMEVQANSSIPKGIPTEVRNQVDGWIFQSERLRGAYPAFQRQFEAIIPPSPEEAKIDAWQPQNHAVWIGPIDGNCERLIQALRSVQRDDDAPKITICGTGKAREVMPAVRIERDINVNRPFAISWTGESYNLAEIAATAKYIIQANLDPDSLELGVAIQGPAIVPVSLLVGDLPWQSIVPAYQAPKIASAAEIAASTAAFISSLL